jgi:hypothetical protein
MKLPPLINVGVVRPRNLGSNLLGNLLRSSATQKQNLGRHVASKIPVRSLGIKRNLATKVRDILWAEIISRDFPAPMTFLVFCSPTDTVQNIRRLNQEMNKKVRASARHHDAVRIVIAAP